MVDDCRWEIFQARTNVVIRIICTGHLRKIFMIDSELYDLMKEGPDSSHVSDDGHVETVGILVSKSCSILRDMPASIVP